MALELVEYQSVAAAVDVLRRASDASRQSATVPNIGPAPSALLHAPLMPTPGGNFAGRVVIPVMGPESTSSRSDSPATASPDILYRYGPQQRYAGINVSMPGVSQVNTRHRITCGDLGDDCDAQASPQSSTASSKSHDLQQMFQRVQKVLQVSSPPPPPLHYQQQQLGSASDTHTTPTRCESPTEVIRCVSPLPTSLANTPADKLESPIHTCHARAFRFYMEQHIENVLKQYRERQERRSFVSDQ